MFLLDMDNKLMTKSADSHGLDIRIGYFSFDPIKERPEFALREDIVEIPIS